MDYEAYEYNTVAVHKNNMYTLSSKGLKNTYTFVEFLFCFHFTSVSSCRPLIVKAWRDRLIMWPFSFGGRHKHEINWRHVKRINPLQGGGRFMYIIVVNVFIWEWNIVIAWKKKRILYVRIFLLLPFPILW